ncbi:MAG: hypothetical protein ACRDV2_08360, partial [Actinomycetes bacterium]
MHVLIHGRAAGLGPPGAEGSLGYPLQNQDGHVVVMGSLGSGRGDYSREQKLRIIVLCADGGLEDAVD